MSDDDEVHTVGTHLVLKCAANHRIGDLIRHGTEPPADLNGIGFIYGGQPSRFPTFIDAGDNFRVRCSGCDKDVCEYAPDLVTKLFDGDEACILEECHD
jgi:hypothetical protein